MNLLFYAILLSSTIYVLQLWGTRQLFKARLYRSDVNDLVGWLLYIMLSSVLILPIYISVILQNTNFQWNVWIDSMPPTLLIILFAEWLYHRKRRQIQFFFQSIQNRKGDAS